MMLGGLHINLAALWSFVALLQNSGWTGTLVDEGVASSGTTEPFLSVASVTRTCQAHQVTACTTYTLMKATYSEYYEQVDRQSGEELSFKDWCEKRKVDSSQFPVL